MRDKYKFYSILCVELALWPLLWMTDRYRRIVCQAPEKPKYRTPVEEHHVLVGVHEWGGYNLDRRKTIKHGATFECGLRGQLERFCGKPEVELVVTISDASRYDEMEYVRMRANNVIEVDNRGMDFSGFAALYERYKNGPNRYVILTNSSVNALQEEFLNGYIDYMEHNLEVGMLGISYCTKMIQTLVRDNFRPHLQSFFLLTTIDVLREVVTLNGGKFPGNGVAHKLLLIRQGEIRLSQLVRKAGYRLAVINPQNGKPYKFECYKRWALPLGDIRQQIDTPNRITPIRS